MKKGKRNWTVLVLGFMTITLSVMYLMTPVEFKPPGLLFDEVSREASYKSVLEHADGSIDVIFNIPRNSDLARKIRESGPIKNHVTYSMKGSKTIFSGSEKSKKSNSTSKKKPGKKTKYPITLNTPYLINNPILCKEVKNPQILVIVHTATDHFQRRRTIRETWANKNILKSGGLRIVFLFGLAKDEKTQIMLENESVVYGDIVQGNFQDTYHNLTHKGVLAYRWVSEFCTTAELIVKVDDDMFVNIFHLLDYYLPLYKKKDRFMSCQVRAKGTSPIVRYKSKWQVGNDEFKNMTHYPVTYCNGYFVLMSPGMIRELYRVSFMTPFFWVDDVYLYGLLPFKAGKVQHIHLGGNLTLNQEHGIKCFTGNKTCNLIASYAFKEGVMEKLWYASLSMYKNLAEKYLPKELLLN